MKVPPVKVGTAGQKNPQNVMLYQQGETNPAGSQTGTEKKIIQALNSNEAGNALAEVVKAWKQICLETKTDNPTLDALLRSGHPTQVKGNTLMVSFASQLLREKADKPDVVEITRKAIKRVLGKDLELAFIASGSGEISSANVKPGGMVAAAMNKGGKIVDIQGKTEPKK